jgi:Uma2 family endonuclease
LSPPVIDGLEVGGLSYNGGMGAEPSEPLPPGYMTYEQFLHHPDLDPHHEWVDGRAVPLFPDRFIPYDEWLHDETISPHTEWCDGRVVPMHAVADRHDAIVRWLNALLDPLVRERELGRLMSEPFVMKVWVDGRQVGRSPDLMFLAAEHRDRVQRYQIDGPADLAVEVVSVGSQQLDRVHKRAEYEAGGVREYWLIDPDAEEALFLRRGDAGAFEAVEPIDGVLRSPLLPAMALRVDWLWAQPLPKTVAIWRDWGLLD